MNITLKPEIEQFIQAQIATGRYANAEEVISKALKLLAEWDKGYQQWEEKTRQKVDVALAQIERGEVLDSETVVMQILNKFQKARDSQKDNLAAEIKKLFKEIQATHADNPLTDEEIAAEIDAYRRGE